MKKLILSLALIPSLLFGAPPTTGQLLFQQKTASGPFDQFGVTPITNQAFGWDGSKVVMLAPSGGVSWGGITGTLSSQTDLQTALNLKLSLAGVLPLAGFSSITGTLPIGNLPGTVQYTNGVLGLAGFSSITGTLADARLSANVQLKNGALALASFGSITGTIGTGNLPATVPDGNLSANVQLQNGTLAIAGFGGITGQIPSANIADLSATYLTLGSAASTYQPLDGDLTSLAGASGTNTIYYRSAANTWSPITIGSGLAFSGGGLSTTNSGTVTSVSLTVPSGFSVSGSPITSSGTLAITLSTELAHNVLAGPTSGSAATPAFRLLVAGDIPDISSTYLTTAAATAGYQPLDADLTALAALSGTNNLYYRSAANTWSTVAFGSGVAFSGGTLSATGTGTVTSVGLTAPGIFAVGNSPIISTGDIALTLATQTANKVWAGPTTGSAATPTFRSLVVADFPDLSATYLTPAAAASAYQPLDGDLTALAALSGTDTIYRRSGANTWTAVTIGTGLSFSTGTLSATTAGTVSSVAFTAPAIFSVSGSPVTTSGTLAVTLANQSANIVWAGPGSGSAATPTFRALVSADIPDISATYLTPGTAATTYQPLDADLTAIAALSGTNTIYYRSAANTWTGVTIGTGLAFSGGSLTNSGVTSVALSLPAMFTVSGSPVTTSGTLSAVLATQAANAFIGGPTTGADAAPTFRTLVAADLPDLSGTFITPAAVAAGYQPLDADLTAIAALSGTNTIYYRSAADTWTAVTLGGNLVFSGGTLTGAGVVANTFTGAQIVSVNGAASTPALKANGTWFTGGSSTTTKPQLLIEPTGTATTTWNTSGTGLGINAASGFTGRLIDLKTNNVSEFYITAAGAATLTGQLNVTGIVDNSFLTVVSTATFLAGINGTTVADDAPAGADGEFVSSTVAVSSAIVLTTATANNITSISLTAGDWDVSANANFNEAAATVTATSATISTSSATLASDGTEAYSGLQTTTLSVNNSVTLPRKRINVSGTTTVYLVGKCTFSAGAVGGWGSITARRIR